MKMRTRILAMTLSGALAVGALAGCGGSSGDNSAAAPGSAAAASNGEPVKISFIAKTLSSEYWQTMQAGVMAYDEEHDDVTVDIKGPPSETSYDEQQNMIETDLTGGYDAYCIAPLQSDLVANLISGQTTPIIAVDTMIDAPEVVSFVGTGNEAAAQAGAEAAVDAAKEAGWEEINCIEIAGVQGDATNTARMTGFQKGIEAKGGTFLADEVQYADAVADKAVNCMEAIIQTHPEGVAIVCTNNDDMAVAAARAAHESGNKNYDNTIFLGFDGQISACESILDGQLTMTTAQQPYEMGYMACETAVAAARGESVDANVDSGSEVVTADTAQARIDKISAYLEAAK